MFFKNILHPEFTWYTAPSPLNHKLPKLRRLSPPILRRFWAHVHKLLVKVSIWYCRWSGIRFSGQICQLPFGLILKWSDGTRLEEVLAMQAARDAGLPVPRVICYGEHDDTPHAPVSILMTRMPGSTLYKELWEWFDPEEKTRFLQELKMYLHAIRRWRQPGEGDSKAARICSIAGTSIRSVRVPSHSIGPCEDEAEFNGLLLDPARSDWARESWPDYQDRLAKAEKLHADRHEIVFTHGDISPYNILVLDDGSVSAVLDWEAAGWYPEYWEFTTAWRLAKAGSWWYEIVKELADGKYVEEREADLEVRTLTADSMAW
jgi:aminoglycoside phosphotransferase (APT) family kinase protein